MLTPACIGMTTMVASMPTANWRHEPAISSLLGSAESNISMMNMERKPLASSGSHMARREFLADEKDSVKQAWTESAVVDCFMI